MKCMLPKRRFWKLEQSVACAFLNDFYDSSPKSSTRARVSTTKPHTQRFVQDSKMFFWGASNDDETVDKMRR